MLARNCLPLVGDSVSMLGMNPGDNGVVPKGSTDLVALSQKYTSAPKPKEVRPSSQKPYALASLKMNLGHELAIVSRDFVTFR